MIYFCFAALAGHARYLICMFHDFDLFSTKLIDVLAKALYNFGQKL
jgi:hypothetical protein